MATPILAILSSVILLNARGLGADTLSNTLLKSSCSGNSIPGSSSGDRFQTNLNTLLSSLKAQAPISNFNTTTAGDGADRAYGLYMCQGDLSSDDCRSCVQDAAAGVPQNCPSNRQGIVWYDYCQLRFSDFDFFGVMDASWGYYGKNEYATIPNPSLPLDVLSRLVEVAPSSQPLKFAANASVTAGVYALAQCTDDLSGKDCRKCLETILKEVKGCCSDAEGYRYLSRSCWVRYESTPFLWKVNSTYTSIVVPRCPNDTFPAGSRSMWEANLKVLLSSLETSSPRSGGFNTSVAGEGSTRLYGLALCRPDVANSTDACRTCLINASSSVTLMCPGRTEGVIWYEKCEIRYSNQSFFGVVDRMGRTFCNPRETSQAYDAASLDLMSRLTEAAPNQPLLYAAGSEAISDSAKSYGLVQCTRDLSSDECRRCLTDGMANVSSACKQRRGWRYLSGSCNLRYEDFAFFDDSKLLTVPSSLGGGKSSKTLIIAIVIPILGTMILGSLIYFSWQRKKRHQGGKKTYLLDDLETLGDTDLHLIDLETVKAATDNFSHTNKIGKGGFGTVYKGKLQGGEVIAVKRLSTRSNQGSEEFKNEVLLIAKLQHRNLVRTLGCCVEGEEKMLIYEYMPNGSLDAFIFDQTKRALLEWKSRFNIIYGIARGLLYLHEDSQLKIIHRDLKPSNVLLDRQMNSKISDFGMAKIFRDDENAANTDRVAGTYGYMAPEYVYDGIFSVKSDVFSFGILLLEILSGQRNGRPHFFEHGLTLIKHAWQLWTEGRAFELVDPFIVNSTPANEAIRCMHIGLLCVQENPEDRPSMSCVVLMLMSEHMVLPDPSQPASFVRETDNSIGKPSSSSSLRSVNLVSITDVQPR